MLVADTTYKMFGGWNFRGQGVDNMLTAELGAYMWETLICKLKTVSNYTALNMLPYH